MLVKLSCWRWACASGYALARFGNGFRSLWGALPAALANAALVAAKGGGHTKPSSALEYVGDLLKRDCDSEESAVCHHPALRRRRSLASSSITTAASVFSRCSENRQ